MFFLHFNNGKINSKNMLSQENNVKTVNKIVQCCEVVNINFNEQETYVLIHRCLHTIIGQT